MNIEYSNPLSNAWDRMKKALFKPFDIGKWFALGFTVFLSQLLSGGGSAGWSFPGSSESGESINWPEIERIPEKARDWLQTHPFWVTIILIAFLIVIGIILIIVWLRSRGTFMFLDNVVHDRALVVKPWRKYKILSNSLFFWRVGFGLVTALLMLPLLALVLFQIVLYSRGHSGMYHVFVTTAIGLLWFVGSVIVGYIYLFTNSFVVPIMYKHDLRVLQAWQKFIPILKSHFLHFILYGLLFLLLIMGVVIAFVLTGCLTCCIVFILLALPYISSVFLLPVSYTFRAFSLEFLAQWGTDYTVFPDESLPPDDVPPPPIPPQAGVTIIGM